jgi:hypothetical protein
VTSDSVLVAVLGAPLAVVFAVPASGQQTCASLTSLQLPLTQLATSVLPACKYDGPSPLGQGDINDADNFKSAAPALSTTQRTTVTSSPPFQPGQFTGTGRWVSDAAEGDYRVAYTIASEAGGAITHVVKRVFLKSDGSVESEENTILTFSRTSGNRIHVALAAAGKTVAEGTGYCLGDHCHYEATIAPGHRLEFTFHISASGLVGLASSTNNGKFMSWHETLAPQGK